MNALLTAVSAAGPMACGWGVHGLLLGRRLTAARRDPLSGLWTRAAFERQALRILGRQMHTALVLVDLDGFKALNDRYGHAAGDAAIRHTAASLTDALSSYPGAVVGRLGGDEFAVVVPLPGTHTLPWLLDALHDAITAPFRHEDTDLTVGVSLGASLSSDLLPAAPQGGPEALSLLMRLADEAMYTAKRAGGGWCDPAASTPGCTTTAGRRTGRPGTTAKEVAA
ncbi:diguanylate cyclase (GGDEF) domain-containing protein [Streptomyces sp. 3213]|uniref:GGDEF domain-containing protein n=1 Tax=Streptomyces sp. 3213.3 TaxID=1855348 RepID=UPI000895D1AB|nr:GGDEF domain-containing protein [Streptomyces sp. 3213.3]SED56846.1 diguanylate cyclase (GGDEF) domain-containing protein [Streptomyces sp. 3213] [Streptomyces sp. 3213.3]